MAQLKSSTAEERNPQMNKRVRVALAALIALAGIAAVLAIYMVGITDQQVFPCRDQENGAISGKETQR